VLLRDPARRHRLLLNVGERRQGRGFHLQERTNFGQELNQKIFKSSNFTEGKINTLPGLL